MKRIIIALCVILLSAFSLTAGGGKERSSAQKAIRVAENVPGLITPGVWDGQAFTLNASIYEYLVGRRGQQPPAGAGNRLVHR